MTPVSPSVDDVTVRPERRDEAGGVADLVREAFGDERVARLVDELRASPDWIDDLSYVAESGGNLVGHVLFTRSWLDAPPRLVDVLVLSPLSVAPEHQGRGVGSALVRAALTRVESRPEPLVFLEGDPAFYRRFGFEPAGLLGFRKPSLRIPDAAFMVRSQQHYAPWMTGTLVYSDVFWRLDCVGLRDTDEAEVESNPRAGEPA
jgi:putative acetyltransferase